MSDYTRAITAALHGPEVKKLKIGRHEFNVKPVQRVWRGDALIAAGQLSHCLVGRRDDQVYYTIIIQGNRVSSIQNTTRNGDTLKKLFEFNHTIGSAVISVLCVPVGAVLGAATPVLADAVGAAERAVIGNWQQAADMIIAVIAVALAEERRPVPSPTPVKPPRPTPPRPTPPRPTPHHPRRVEQ